MSSRKKLFFSVLFLIGFLSGFFWLSETLREAEISSEGGQRFIVSNDDVVPPKVGPSPPTVESNNPLEGPKVDDQNRQQSQKFIFYNAYISPTGSPNPVRAKKIISEHIKSIMSSYGWTEISALYYNMIGVDTFIENCTKCVRLAHYQTGDEQITLQRLYEHCLMSPQDEVVYLHSKGTFHDHPNNNRLRSFLTKGVLSKGCMKDKPSNCTVCSSRFSIVPHYHNSGNMWVAKCSYIKDLIPPKDFREKMNQIRTHLKGSDMSRAGNCSAESDPFLGTGRFANEHWVHHHPSVIPCDLYDNPNYMFDYAPLPPTEDSWTPTVRPAPRFTLPAYLRHVPPCAKGNRSKGDCDWQLTLLGRLTEFRVLYNDPNIAPPNGSWIWNFHPTESP